MKKYPFTRYIVYVFLLFTFLIGSCAKQEIKEVEPISTEEGETQVQSPEALDTEGDDVGKNISYTSAPGGQVIQVESARDSVIMRINAEIATLDPHKTSGTGNERIVQYQFYESLFRIDTFNNQTEVNLGLASGYEYLDEEKTLLQIRVREGVKFHNGDLLTADDVVYSINRAKETGFNNVVGDFIDQVEKVDDYTVNFKLISPYSAILRVLASGQLSIVNQNFIDQHPDDFGRLACGTGAYVFKEWIAGDSISFTAFEDYWRGKPSIKNGKFAIIPDNSTALIALENGEVDIMSTMGTADIEIAKSNKDLNYFESSTGTGGRCIIFNTGTGIFSDKRLRLAVAHAIDRESIWLNAYDGTGDISYVTMSSSLSEFPDEWTPLEYDLEKAKQLVIDAGYPNGVTVKVPTIDSPVYSKPTVVLQEQLAQVGIFLEIDLMERAAWNDKIVANSDFEITYWAIVPDYEDADAILYKFHSKNIGGKGNFFNYANPELDNLLDEGRATESGLERDQIYYSALEVIRDDAVVISTHYSKRMVPANVNLLGAKAVPEQKYYFFDWYWGE